MDSSNQSVETKINVTLPIPPGELTDLSVTPNSCKALLNWKSVKEQAVDRFEIEYSADNIEFAKAATIPVGNKPAGSAFGFIHEQREGRGYYRLKIIGKNGGFTYSKIVSVDIKCPDKKAF